MPHHTLSDHFEACHQALHHPVANKQDIALQQVRQTIEAGIKTGIVSGVGWWRKAN
ncbi:hypothetical protein SAMN04487867_12392 [Vreelandella titanicae]|uniref:hypothetical protein n=1 Tax=Vreelandella titanicae TaxID=664683 RepID=UPI00088EC700|nr:hypothetical protein [Halomonas titanicae]SDJ10018.1 hypothetical protein SAMN04487867_12392 [Halomonas titanicae]|tara:strand:- start:1404 stop:1571 length:168 start_codon:yes stop_codon:yes gene_type:complete